MEIEKLKRKTIERLKKAKAEKNLTIPKIMELLDARGAYVSESTVKRVFSEGSEEVNFKYQDSIAPLADVLLDLYNDSSNIDDIDALRQIVREKNKLIEALMVRIEDMKQAAIDTKAAHERGVEHLKGQIKKLNERLDFREQCIERKDELFEMLLKAYLPKV